MEKTKYCKKHTATKLFKNYTKKGITWICFSCSDEQSKKDKLKQQ